MRGMAIQIIISLAIMLTQVACDEEKNTGAGEDISGIQEDTNTDEIVVESEEDNYEVQEYSFRGNLNLREDLYINAKHIYFRPDSRVKINQFRLILEAETITFEDTSSIIAFNENEYASCKTHGKSAGFIEVYAESISGNTFIDLAGQHAGQIGFYKDPRLSGPIHSSHGVGRTGFYLGCGTYVTGKYPKDIPELLVPKNPGENGAVLLEVVDHSNFNPNMSDRQSHGSYAARIEGRSGTVSWWRDTPVGPIGQSGEICFKVSGEFLCR